MRVANRADADCRNAIKLALRRIKKPGNEKAGDNAPAFFQLSGIPVHLDPEAELGAAR
jgi:hypothetical protein